MKTVCVYHSIDLDGWMSAAIVKHWFKTTYNCIDGNSILDTTVTGDTLHFIGYNYGQPIPDLSEYDKVIMCDISFPKEIMQVGVVDDGKKLIWIDHHISAINDSKADKFYEYDKTEGLRDTKFAACELTWKYFFPNETMPEIVRLLGRYDCFGHKGTSEEQKVLEFQYGARAYISNYEEAYESLKINILDDSCNICEEEREVSVIHNKGIGIYHYLCTEAKQVYKNGFEIVIFEPSSEPGDIPNTFIPKKFICINKEKFNPINFGIDYHKDGYDGAACFHYANEMWNFSLYNDNGEVDCPTIAKQYGGGGHVGAAGFRLTNEEFLELISK